MRDVWPGVVGLYELSTRPPEHVPSNRFLDERDHFARERLGIVRGDEMLPGRQRQPFGADAGRNDRLLHRQCFENLQPRAAAGSQRHDVDGRFRDVRPNILDGPRHQDSGSLGDCLDSCARPPANDGK
jgi:hypothetical protein